MKQTPILFLSDSPSCSSGLGRITRELSMRLHERCPDIFRVATLGYGGPGSCSIPFQQYCIEGMHNWFIPTIKQVWEDFAGDEPGVIFTIWDASRLLWFARPAEYRENKYIRDWLINAPFKRWGYIPIDAAGPNNQLSCMIKECLLGYDQLLAYTNWGDDLIRSTIGDQENIGNLPHGIDTDVFSADSNKSKSRQIFRDILGFKGPEFRKDEILVGIVATNQDRKDYGFAIHMLAELSQKIPIRIFIQTDMLERRWSIPALLSDYGLLANAIVNCAEIDDSTMAMIYSACDVTLGIGLGEGFGFPIFESLACGTPCITGSYGGQAEFMDKQMLVKPEMFRLEGLYNCIRPVYSRKAWIRAIEDTLRMVRAGRLNFALPAELDWKNLWVSWEAWFREAHASLTVKEPEEVNAPNNSNVVPFVK